jgi:hypothetical protein
LSQANNVSFSSHDHFLGLRSGAFAFLFLAIVEVVNSFLVQAIFECRLSPEFSA